MPEKLSGALTTVPSTQNIKNKAYYIVKLYDSAGSATPTICSKRKHETYSKTSFLGDIRSNSSEVLLKRRHPRTKMILSDLVCLQPKNTATSKKDRIPFIITHNPFNPPNGKTLTKYRRILEISEELKPVLESKTLVIYKRAINLKKLLVCADIDPPIADRGSSPCGKPCTTCPFMEKTENITSWRTKEQFKIKGRFNCKTKNVIYVISCKKCGLQYVGQSGNMCNERLR